MNVRLARRPIAALAAAAIAATVASTVVVAPVLIADPASASTASGQPATEITLQGTGFSRPGVPTTFTAALFPATPVAGEPNATGTVSFFDGSRLLGNVPLATDDTAAFTTSTLAAGLHTITAAYNGDAHYAGSTSDPLTQEVATPANFTSSNTLSGVVGAPLSFTVTSVGFPPPLLKAAGNLDGLTLADHGDGTGTLSGAPVAAGTFRFSISAGSLVNSVTTQFLTLTVTVSPLTVTTAALPVAFAGQAYSATLIGQGGNPPYMWSLASGQLPKGLTLNPATGVLSGTPTASGTAGFTVRLTDSGSPTRRIATKALSLVSNGIVPAVYATNGGSDSVTSYPLSAGNLAPSTRLAGTAQGLNGPDGVVLNDAGRLFVADSGTNSITEYDRGASTPTATIAGPITGLAGPAGLTLDGAGRLYVANRTANSVTVFAAGVSGNAGPLFTVVGPDTGLSSPAAVAIDGTGRLWVANASANSLTAYAAGASGDAKPVARIVGSATGLNAPQGLAEDAGGNLLAVNTFGGSVTAYATGALSAASNPNVFPVRTISGSGTGLSFPDGIDVDSSGRIYVANQFDNHITSYAPSANGNAAPLTVIAGDGTGLAGPGAIAITPPLSVATRSLPVARVGRSYRIGLAAAQGTSPYAWTLVRGWLPGGLRLERDGTLAGTPYRSGRWVFTVRVTDAAHPRTAAQQELTLIAAPR
jgi:serine/threonine protein kinase, bacterial